MPRWSATADWVTRSRGGIADHFGVAAAAVLLMLPSLVDGIPKGHSFWFNLNWATEFSRQMAAGDPYPRWLEGLWAGAGGADLFFYAPLPFWLVGGLRLAFCPECSADRLVVLSGVLWLALSGFGFRCLARRFASRWPAVIGAVVYMALPYHLGIDWMDRQALAEFAAAALIPWHLAAFLDCAKGVPAGPRLAGLTALILLCHLPAALILAIGCAALMPCIDRAPGWRNIARIGCAGLVGLGLSAIYWVPALAEIDTVKSNSLREGYLHWSNWLLSPASLLVDSEFVTGLWWGFIALVYAADFKAPGRAVFHSGNRVLRGARSDALPRLRPGGRDPLGRRPLKSGAGSASRRAAMLTPSPYMSSPSAIASPRLTPMRKPLSNADWNRLERIAAGRMEADQCRLV